jgi:hypothetical protein
MEEQVTDFERDWLLRAVTRAGYDDPQDFIQAVFKRLKKGEEAYADNPSQRRPFTEIMEEGKEEAEDIPGWMIRGAHRLRDETLNPAAREHIEKMLVDIAADAVKSRLKIDQVIEFFEEEQVVHPAPEIPREPIGCIDAQ